MRCSNCGTDNAPGSRFCNQCATPLSKRCAKCASENAPEARCCAQCAAPLDTAAAIRTVTEPHDPLTGERRHLTVLFCDLVNSTRLAAQLDPEEWREIVAGYHRAAAQAIERFGGHVAQYLGDGVMAYFGWPEAHDNDAERAARAGVAILHGISKLNEHPTHPKLSARVGIDSGAVVVGAGAGKEADVFGDVPNVAARVQTAAAPDTVLITAATHRLTSGLFVVEDRGVQALKGIERPVQLYRVVRPSGVRGRLEAAAAAHALTPFVGREDELRLLMNRWERALDGEGQVALIVGEAGIGKSRLVLRFHEQIAGTPHTWVEAAAGAFFQNTPFYAVTEMLRELLTWRVDESAEKQLTQMENRLELAGLKPAEALPLIARLLNLPLPAKYPPLSLSPEQQRRRLLATLVERLLGHARLQPIVIVTEDLHWADPSTLELIQLLVEQGTTGRLLLLYTARPEFRAQWPPRGHHTQITLNRLSSRNVRAIVGEVAARKALSEQTIATLVERTSGVPLFVEEMTRAVLESGNATLTGYEIPVTLHDSLMSRLDRLGPAKEVLQIASVIGGEFSYNLLHAVHPIAEEDLQRALRKLADTELLYIRGSPPEAMYAFKHSLIQDAAYEALLKTRRRELHRIVANKLTQYFPELIEAQPETLAHHYTEAGQAEQAITYWQRAGTRAAKRAANAEAVSHLRRGLALLEALPARAANAEQELNILIALGPALMTTMSSAAPDVQHVYTRARQLAQETGKVAQLFVTIWGLWLAAFTSGDREAFPKFADELFAIAHSQSDAGFLLQSYHAAWPTAFFFGDLTTTHEHADAGLALYNKDAHRQHALVYGGHDPAVCGYALDAFTLQILGYPDRALKQLDQGLKLARQLEHAPSLVHSLWFGAELYYLRRDTRMTISIIETWLAIASGYASTVGAANMMILRCWSQIISEDFQTGLPLLRDGVSHLRATGSKFQIAYRLGRAVEALRKAGETEEALALLSECFRANTAVGERWYEAELHRLKGELLLIHDDSKVDEAAHCFRAAIDVARVQSAKSWELRATTSLARLLDSQGRREEARTMLCEIYGWFTEGFDTADLKDAKALLDELSV